jgi:hypothetical protein
MMMGYDDDLWYLHWYMCVTFVQYIVIVDRIRTALHIHHTKKCSTPVVAIFILHGTQMVLYIHTGLITLVRFIRFPIVPSIYLYHNLPLTATATLTTTLTLTV